MIVLILRGGLGNQMFEYAMAKALALRTDQELVINTHLGFQRDKVFNRVFCLDALNVSYVQRKLLSFDFPGGYIVEKLSRKTGRHVLFPWYKYMNESSKKFPASEVIEHCERYRNCIVYGEWVKVDYFSDAETQIREDFQLAKSMPPHYLDYEARIACDEYVSVAIGVRIYQEIKDETTRNNGFFYVDAAFFEKAIKYYQDKYPKVKFFIFTQAKDWVRENFPLDSMNFTFVESLSGDRNAVYEMFLFSKCKHYILSNSSFYFWGCWLNPDKNKEVIIPKRWTNSSLSEWAKM